MSVSDLMTGLMVIFLFVAIAYINKVQEHSVTLKDYVEVKENLHDKLVSKFQGDTAKWQMTIGSDLSMKFKNASVLFEQGSDQLSPEFRNVLADFLPRYFDILLNDSLRNHITEIRIEGHTDNWGYPQLDKDPYIANVILSQKRALNVLRFFRSLPEFQKYTPKEKELLEYWFTANGLSYGKALDSEGEYIHDSHHAIDLPKSRRVEFRIITDSEKLLENFVGKNKQ